MDHDKFITEIPTKQIDKNIAYGITSVKSTYPKSFFKLPFMMPTILLRRQGYKIEKVEVIHNLTKVKFLVMAACLLILSQFCAFQEVILISTKINQFKLHKFFSYILKSPSHLMLVMQMQFLGTKNIFFITKINLQNRLTYSRYNCTFNAIIIC